MSRSTFRARLDSMVRALRAHPRVEIYEYVVRPGAKWPALKAAEAAIGQTLPEDLRAFYAAHDGIFLEWGIRGVEYAAKTGPFEYPDYGQPPGCINLLPVEVAMSSSWEQESHVNEIQPDHRARIFGEGSPTPPFGSVCVDNFAKYNHGDLILGPEPVMVASSDHGADMEASDWCSFSVYLDLTLAIFATNRYYNGIGIGWTREPERLAEWTRRPTLDAVVAEILKEAGEDAEAEAEAEADD
ncbi:MAG: SMI1/KNR4 family protein [Nannocystaceae bacterium]